jgi:2-dehydropantoate 2-reductase
MTDLVVGGGAVGTLVAWALATGGRDVAIVRRRLEGGPRPGEVFVVDRAGVRQRASVTEVATPADLPAPPELIVFAVKMFDLAVAAESCAVWPETTALTVANGIGAEEIVANARPEAGLIAGSVTASVDPLDEHTVARLNSGGIALAAVRGDAAALVGELVAALEAAGLPVREVDNAAAMKWSKLLANLVGNASSAIVDVSPAELYDDPAIFRIERRQLREALAIMTRLGLSPVSLPGADARLLALGVRLPPGLARPLFRRVVEGARGGKDPSLRVHARSGRGLSEVDWLNGAVVTAAERLGGSAPVNRRLTELVHEVLGDPDRAAWFRGHPERLVAEVSVPA